VSVTATVFETLKRVSENVTRVYQSGIAVGVKQAGEVVKNEFWDGVFSGTNWQRKFSGSSWNDKTFYPTRNLVCGTHADSMFSLCEITDLAGRLRECGVTLDTSKVTVRADNMFNYATKLTTVPYLDVRKCTYSGGVLAGMFAYCTALKTIEGIHLSEDGLQVLGTSVFSGCAALENVTFYGTIGDKLSLSPCVKLSKASIQNIIGHLSDTASGKTLTLSKTAVNNAFTDAEWTALADTKKNWTISLA
jgi:hypothetical protein